MDLTNPEGDLPPTKDPRYDPTRSQLKHTSRMQLRNMNKNLDIGLKDVQCTNGPSYTTLKKTPLRFIRSETSHRCIAVSLALPIGLSRWADLTLRMRLTTSRDTL